MSRFLTLPPEIRLTIYGLLLSEYYGVKIPDATMVFDVCIGRHFLLNNPPPEWSWDQPHSKCLCNSNKDEFKSAISKAFSIAAPTLFNVCYQVRDELRPLLNKNTKCLSYLKVCTNACLRATLSHSVPEHLFEIGTVIRVMHGTTAHESSADSATNQVSNNDSVAATMIECNRYWKVVWEWRDEHNFRECMGHMPSSAVRLKVRIPRSTTERRLTIKRGSALGGNEKWKSGC